MLSANGDSGQPQKGGLILNGKKSALIAPKSWNCLQNPEDQLFSASVMQDISLGRSIWVWSEPKMKARDGVAELCELAGLLDRPTHALNGGEKRGLRWQGFFAMGATLFVCR